MEKLTIEAWPVARLRPYTRQLRKNDKNIERMIACIQEFGFRVPILARPDGEVIDGDLRLKAAQKMGLESVPVIPAEGMSEEQVRAFRILANSSVAWSTWDDEALAQELRDLWDADFNLELTGLELSEVEDLLQSIEPESQEQGDAVPCQHEPILYGWKPGATHSWLGGRKRRSVQELSELGAVKVAPDGTVSLFLNDRALHISGQNLEVQDLESSLVFEDKPQRSELHPTMKPVALVERFLKNSSRKGEVVLDPFGGSGTTLIACERTRRACRTIELDTKFADVIIRRWQEHTGKDAVLQSTGERFAMLEAANG
ncbi:site-specific DNA-methyltransferase [Desulfobaculum bizertense]|uniref:site-specific DNA-methyltransferase n=1 Tax=Desulfobaculum bizertense TaxID=376490 RepID=UPI001F1B1DD1|nr:DNA methyltransferase [Desulfobaculum bizertense]UIJ38708.1 site-specific DNA-methyltransferase [Desulfobaculum bizertense]